MIIIWKIYGSQLSKPQHLKLLNTLESVSHSIRFMITIILIFLDGSPRGAIASRIADHNSSRVLRIVDFIGDPSVLGYCGSAFQKLMTQQNIEYIDFWQYGILSVVLERAGFHKVDAGGKLICPNYFEPFIAKNERILCCIKGSFEKSFIVCRADGDQDRPNQL